MAHLDDWTPIAAYYDPLMAGSIDCTDTVPHDHGIVRAMEANYKPNRFVRGDPKRTVFIARLSPNTDEDMIEEHFSKFGDIKKLRLVRDVVTGYSKRYAFVEYYDDRSAYSATKETRTFLDDTEIFVEFECERTLRGWVPRRLGGGFGGRKEAGQLRFGGRDKPFRKPIIVPAYKYNKDENESSYQGYGRSRERDRSGRWRENRESRESYREQDVQDKKHRSTRDYERNYRSDNRHRSRRSRSRSRDRKRSRSRDDSRDRDRHDKQHSNSSHDRSRRTGRF